MRVYPSCSPRSPDSSWSSSSLTVSASSRRARWSPSELDRRVRTTVGSSGCRRPSGEQGWPGTVPARASSPHEGANTSRGRRRGAGHQPTRRCSPRLWRWARYMSSVTVRPRLVRARSGDRSATRPSLEGRRHDRQRSPAQWPARATVRLIAGREVRTRLRVQGIRVDYGSLVVAGRRTVGCILNLARARSQATSMAVTPRPPLGNPLKQVARRPTTGPSDLDVENVRGGRPRGGDEMPRTGPDAGDRPTSPS